jgi:hypothetical protein
MYVVGTSNPAASMPLSGAWCYAGHYWGMVSGSTWLAASGVCRTRRSRVQSGTDAQRSRWRAEWETTIPPVMIQTPRSVRLRPNTAIRLSANRSLQRSERP